MKKAMLWGLALFVLLVIGQASQSGPSPKAAGGAPASQGIIAQNVPGRRAGLPRPPVAASGSEVKVTTDYGRMELRFVLNDGQLDKGVAYYVQGKDKSVYFRPDGLTFVLNQSARPERRGPDRPGQGHRVPAATSQSKSWSVGLDFVGAREDLRPEGRDLTDGIVSYFKGRPEDWKTGLPTYARLAYPEVWPGIDLAYSGTVSRLKYEFVVKPGADPGKIRLAYRGASEVRADEAGGLEVVTPLGSFHDGAPVAYQEVDGKRVPVSAAYELSESVQGRRGNSEDSGSVTYGFSVGDYDRNRPLILDPVVFVYCGFIGGDSDTEARDIVVDTSGNAFITGYTWASTGTFPVTVGPDLTYSSSYDAFVAKLNPSGTGYLYCGYLGGTSGDSGEGIAIDASGNAYLAGYTDSSAATFPVLTGPDLVWNGLDDAFMAKVTTAGAISYCGYIGGSDADWCEDIAIDSSENACLTAPPIPPKRPFRKPSAPTSRKTRDIGTASSPRSWTNRSGSRITLSAISTATGRTRWRSISEGPAPGPMTTGAGRSSRPSTPRA